MRCVPYDPKGSMELNNITTQQGSRVVATMMMVMAALGRPYDQLVPEDLEDPWNHLMSPPYKMVKRQGRRWRMKEHMTSWFEKT